MERMYSSRHEWNPCGLLGPIKGWRLKNWIIFGVSKTVFSCKCLRPLILHYKVPTMSKIMSCRQYNQIVWCYNKSLSLSFFLFLLVFYFMIERRIFRVHIKFEYWSKVGVRPLSIVIYNGYLRLMFFFCIFVFVSSVYKNPW